MTKASTTNANRKASAAAAAPKLEIGARVLATTAATLGEPASGAISAVTASGWYVVTLDAPEAFPGCKGGKLSARASSLQPEPPAPVEDYQQGKAAPAGSLVAQLAAANTPATKETKPAKTPKAKPEPKLPTECPECESGELETEHDEETGVTLVTCPGCGWEESIQGESAEEISSKMSEALKKAREHYTKDKRPSGAATAHNGDIIAKELRWYEPLEVCELADRCLLTEPGYHAKRYENLNPGQKRMNSGNRIRAAYRKATEDNDEVVLARINKVLQLVDSDDELADEGIDAPVTEATPAADETAE